MIKTITLTKAGDYTFTLDREGAELNVRGAFWLKDHDQLSLKVTVIHAAPHTRARIDLRAVVDGQARAVLNGIIKVAKAGQQTDSYLNEKVLLLSEKATAEAVPNLEIEADDVKCSHAATIGTLDEDELFYLTSRGITPTQAKSLIAEGFLRLQ